MSQGPRTGTGLQASGLLAMVLLAPLFGWGPVAEPELESTGQSLEPGQRSMVLITIDTLRPNRLEPHGARDVETPRVTALAEEWMRLAMQRDPSIANSYLFLAELLESSNRPEEAASILETSLERWPEGAQFHSHLGLLLGDLYGGPLGRPDLARTRLETFLLAAPADPRAHLVRERLGQATGALGATRPESLEPTRRSAVGWSSSVDSRRQGRAG